MSQSSVFVLSMFVYLSVYSILTEQCDESINCIVLAPSRITSNFSSYPGDDLGNVINYTGAGGQDKQGELVEDQALFRGNAALAKSHETGKPVRVVRGPMKESIYAPLRGYRYS